MSAWASTTPGEIRGLKSQWDLTLRPFLGASPVSSWSAITFVLSKSDTGTYWIMSGFTQVPMCIRFSNGLWPNRRSNSMRASDIRTVHRRGDGPGKDCWLVIFSPPAERSGNLIERLSVTTIERSASMRALSISISRHGSAGPIAWPGSIGWKIFRRAVSPSCSFQQVVVLPSCASPGVIGGQPQEVYVDVRDDSFTDIHRRCRTSCRRIARRWHPACRRIPGGNRHQGRPMDQTGGAGHGARPGRDD